MKLALLGATGRTGRHVANQALGLGHDVKALVRTPDKLQDLRSKVEVLSGDATNAADVERLVAGTDVVIFALGHDGRSSGDMQTVAIRNVLTAMKRHGVARLISLTGAGVIDDNDRPSLVGKLFGVALQLFAKKIHEDAVNHAEAVRAGDRDWTIVRVPMLRDGPGGKEIKVGYAGNGPGTKIDRADVARFMLQQVNDKAWVRKAPMISN
jgi:putative NADH-flavin reductase